MEDHYDEDDFEALSDFSQSEQGDSTDFAISYKPSSPTQILQDSTARKLSTVAEPSNPSIDALEQSIRSGCTSEVLSCLQSCECEKSVMMALGAMTEGTLSVVSADPKTACAAVCSLLNRPFQQRSQIVQLSFQLLRSLAYTDSNKLILAEDGALQSIVRAMDLLLEDIHVQIGGALTLRTLASSAQIRGMMVEEQVLGTVVRSMTCHKRSLALQAAGCKLLHVLCFDDSTKPKIIHARGVIVATTALLTFPEAAELQAGVCAILYFMVFEIESMVAKDPEGELGKNVVQAAVSVLVLAKERVVDGVPHAMAVLAAILSNTEESLALFAAKEGLADACLAVLASTEDDELILDTINALHALLRFEEALDYYVEQHEVQGLRSVAGAAKHVLARTDDRDVKIYCESILTVVNAKRSNIESSTMEQSRLRARQSEMSLRQSPEVPDIDGDVLALDEKGSVQPDAVKSPRRDEEIRPPPALTSKVAKPRTAIPVEDAPKVSNNQPCEAEEVAPVNEELLRKLREAEEKRRLLKRWWIS